MKHASKGPDAPAIRRRKAKTVAEHLARAVHDADTGCHIWPTPHNAPTYGRFSIRQGDNWKKLYAHRAAWELAYGAPPAPGLQVAHRCNRPQCCNPDHLYLATAARNMADAARDGLCRRRFLKPELVRSMRQAKAAGASYTQLQADTGFTVRTVLDIVQGRTHASASARRVVAQPRISTARRAPDRNRGRAPASRSTTTTKHREAA